MPSPSRAPPPPPPALSAPSSKNTGTTSESPQQYAQDPPRLMFRPLEIYVVACFSSVECLNSSFLPVRSHHLLRAASEGASVEQCTARRAEDRFALEIPFPEMDAKTLLLGDFAENGTWWTGRSHLKQSRSQGNAYKAAERGSEEKPSLKSPPINWAELDEWYHAIVTVGRSWRQRLQILAEGNLLSEKGKAVLITASTEDLGQIEEDCAEACAHVHRALLKVSENLLRRPGRPLKTPEDCRFLLILLTNPLLYMPEIGNATQSAVAKSERSASQSQSNTPRPLMASLRQLSASDRQSPSTRNGSTGKHSGITKRILGLMSNLPSDCHHHLVIWFSQFSEMHFRRIVDLIGSFVTHRLTRQHGRKRSNSHDPHGGLIPSISGPGPGSSAQLHAALGSTGASKSPDRNDGGIPYGDDWQIKAAARVMSLFFSANNHGSSRRQDGAKTSTCAAGRSSAGSAARNRAHRHGQILPTNAFYNTLLDYSDLVADFEAWESRKGRFSFCQYPMFLSIWAKIRIMEHDARRQMEIKAREAFFDSIMSRKAINQYLVLKVRRNCLVEDSLRSVSEVVGTGQEEIKKGLRIEFMGEEGLDSGGLRKEWFLLLVREVFDPEHGLFVYDEDSHYCYFNPGTFETSDQFFLVGVVIGLAIYNSTILDVALPPFAFRKLLASAPIYSGPATSSSRPSCGYTLEDLAEFRPTLAKGLRQLLEFEGDVKETFCRDFVAVGERYGQLVEVPLCSNGGNRAVTNSNRHEFVELYIKHLLDTSVARQYEPFKRGFFTVCGGNALSLFRPEEIELLVRGSDEPLDVATLRTVAIYDGWGKGINASDEPVVDWFWDGFGKASAKDQRKLLSFITSSDRIPAMGATSLVIKIICLGDHSNRFPIARTCFNMLGLYRYCDRSVLEDKLWRAVIESEGFGMK
ncbi:MAG: Putative E3 ubiquitin-protein ligase [Alectoria sarmentosa]|nr:MAG: Putative E3 ubiquitin-protein ligase [Alectoria sarmentosa]CAD6593038.1 MAG: Putative E3 ubiquitin-protein ligase [Alectoria sarmentosa]